MNKLIYLITCLFILGTMSTFSSCKKDDDSSLQPKGNYGNVVMRTKLFDNQTPKWDVPGQYLWIINDVDITQSVLENGQVIVSKSNGNWIFQNLPFSTNFNGTSLSEHYMVEISLGTVTVFQRIDDFRNYNPGISNFKISCIQPL